ncbi:MAG: UDP-N-acetylmuramate--L-alanine ligase [Christensenellales bacterium]|jgi:UDP-N-acetylmuramate--alanine ligase
MAVNIRDFKGKRIHLIGIGGTSMNALAMILSNLGYEVTGSDRGESLFTQPLRDRGIPVTIGQREENVHGAALVVYSAAIKPENPERAEAKRLNIPEMERSVLLGQISGQYETVVGVAGCHGKTTMTSMIAKVAIDADLDPTVHVGGFVDFLGGGTALGKSGLFITEACEYVDSYLTLHPTIAVISNIDNDHLDYFKTEENIYRSFEKYAALLPDEGLLIAGYDDEKVRKLAKDSGKKTVTFGITGGDYSAQNIVAGHDGITRFAVTKCGKPMAQVSLTMPGEHNVKNALAAFAVCDALGVPHQRIAESLSDYRLTRRRFEYYGEMDGAKVYHDFAHHPAEIAACLQGARSVCDGKLYAVLQCNSYTRAKTLFTGDMSCMKDADCAIVPDIYPGRETDDGTVHAKDIVKAIEASDIPALYLPTFEDIRDWLKKNVKPGDMVVTMGSGDVYEQTKIFLR